MFTSIKHGARKVFAGATLLSLEIIILFFVFTTALLAFIGIAKMVFKEKKETFDHHAFNFLAKFVSDINTDVMRFFTFLGTHTFLIPANLALAAFLLIKKHKWYSLKVPVVALSSLLLMFGLKLIFHRDRPITPLLEQAAGYSFPSGHALMSITFYGLIIYLIWQNERNNVLKWLMTIMLALLIIFIGVSRVYLRVHYASDVLAGFSVGLMWLLLSLWVLNKLESYSSKKVDPVVQLAE